MRKIVSVVAFAALAWGPVSAVQAMDLSVAVGQTGDSTMTYRLGTQFDFQQSWFASDVGRLTGYWDAAYTYWDGDQTASNHSLSLSPVLVYEFAGERFKPYLEAGIGIAAFSSTELEDNDLGSSFQFEDRIGFGVRFADQEVGVRALHYSNAGLKQPNDGVESYSVHYRLSF
ncbi:lipid A 3-O-deacylase [Pseudomonas guineae]|uniref:Lipid A deacylase n=1 Tax=Pseudomonas guineae TaxID=425504 RepID=A0A1I3PJR2_9PSED|nr:acyloxyacyl hydrolase [Pseudomonas guineae]SFJ21914.1 lipid A 3-O-deacylase [Pseudomonas guineae]|tara:strand:- start:9019 stop:9534 length:516 start_codon:yes stop_codon:yes gene_type:complete